MNRRIVWDKYKEWWPILNEALPHAETTGQSLAECIERVMNHQLPPERHRLLRDIRTSLNNDAVKAYIKEFRQQRRPAPAPARTHTTAIAQAFAQAAAQAPAQAPAPAVREHPSLSDVQRLRRQYKGGFRWTTKEWALMAREYDARTARGEGATDFLRFLDAQDAVIDLERRRAVGGIRREWSRGKVLQSLEMGRANIWTLPQEEEPAPEQEAQAEPTSAPAAAPAFDPSYLLADPPPEPFAAQVSQILAHAVEDILRLHHQRVMQVFDERLQVFVQGVRAEVHATLEAELGGPVQAPQSPVAPAGSEVQPEPFEPPRKRLAVDVVGFSGAPVEEVRRGVNGEVDVRFISPEHARSAGQHFRPNVIAATQFISHSARLRMQKEAKRFIPINGNASQVIAAIQQLQAEQSQPFH